MLKIHIVVLKRTNNKCEMKRRFKTKRNNCRKAGMYILIMLIVVLINTTYDNSANKSIEKNMFVEEIRAGFASEKLEKSSSKNTDVLQKYHRWTKQVKKEVVYFPLPEPVDDTKFKITFENSWMLERTYGGKRGHEGCDLMVANSKAGTCPVVSMTDGTITNLGWTEKGGYRIGVTSGSGTYYYYAHLDSYTNLKIGDYVRAGELLGYMGDSGYGAEGTVGQFPAHLHFGIYFYENGKEISVNPYEVLLFLENKKLIYSYF